MANNVTGGNLYHLWRISDVHLPRVADVFFDATRLISGGAASTSAPVGGQAPVTHHDSDGFRANTAAYPGASIMTSSIGAAWADLRDELQFMYAQIGETVIEAAQGVRQATDAFLHADGGNADLLKNYLNDPTSHDLKNPASNPPVADSPDDPGNPDVPDYQDPDDPNRVYPQQ